MDFIANLSTNFLNTLKRFPMVILSAYLFTLIMFIFVTVGHGAMEKYPYYPIANNIAFSSTLAMVLFFLLRLLSPNRILTLLGVVLMVGYYWMLPEDLKSTGLAFMKRHFLIIVALFIFSIVAPFLFVSTKNEDFWEWTQQIIFALLATFIFSFILFVGLEGAKYALEKLFDVTITYKDHIEERFGLVIFGLFSINYFLSQVPEKPLSILSRPYTKIENIFTRYILTPFVIVYFLILFAYTGKIIYLAQWPTGVMAWLVLIFSALAILMYLFWTPLWNERNQKYKKWIWIAILLQTLVLGMSIYLRIEQYGVTENRYFLAIAGIWLFVTALYFLLFRNASYKWIFVSIPLLIIMSQVGNFSAREISKESQLSQLQRLLNSDQLLSEGSDMALKYQISSKIEYLYDEYGVDALMPIIPNIVMSYKAKNHDDKGECSVVNPYENAFPNYATKELGFKYIDRWTWEQRLKAEEYLRPIFIHVGSRYGDNVERLNIKGYEWLQGFSYNNQSQGVAKFCPPEGQKPSKSKDQNPLTLEANAQTITIKKSTQVIAMIKVDDFIAKIKEKWNKKYKDLHTNMMLSYEDQPFDPEELTLSYEDEKIRVKFLFNVMEFFPKEQKLMHYSGRALMVEK